MIAIEGLDPVLVDITRRIREYGSGAESEAQQLVATHAARLYDEVHAATPQGPTGNLRAGLAVIHPAPLVSRVKGYAPHTHLIEDGWQHTTRRIPGRHILARSAITARARLYDEAEQMLQRVAQRAGLDVR